MVKVDRLFPVKVRDGAETLIFVLQTLPFRDFLYSAGYVPFFYFLCHCL